MSLLRNRGQASLNTIHGLAEELGYKQSNAERQMRKLCEQGLVSANKNEKGYISSYNWFGAIPNQTKLL